MTMCRTLSDNAATLVASTPVALDGCETNLLADCRIKALELSLKEGGTGQIIMKRAHCFARFILDGVAEWPVNGETPDA